jgi:hypothetical protein
MGPQLVERRRQGERVRAERGDARHLAQHRDPGLAVPGAVALGDGEDRVEDGARVPSHQSQHGMRVPEPHRRVSQTSQGRLQDEDGRLRLVLHLGVGRISGAHRVASEQIVLEPDPES